MGAKVTVDNVDACLTALTTALGATSVVHFSTNKPAITDATVVGDFTEDTSTGITGGNAVATWSAPYTDALTQLRTVTGAAHTFICSAAPSGLSLECWYVTDMAGTTLEGAGYLPVPIPIVNVGDGFEFAPTFDQNSFANP